MACRMHRGKQIQYLGHGVIVEMSLQTHTAMDMSVTSVMIASGPSSKPDNRLSPLNPSGTTCYPLGLGGPVSTLQANGQKALEEMESKKKETKGKRKGKKEGRE